MTRRLIRGSAGRWALVTVDIEGNQCTALGTSHVVCGTGDDSQWQAAEYAIAHGESWPSRADAIRALLRGVRALKRLARPEAFRELARIGLDALDE